MIDVDSLRAILSREPRLNRLDYRPTVTSTNDVALQMGAAGEAAGVVVVAETQTHGRGRHGRSWVSAPGAGLWCSLLLRPRLAAGAAHLLTVGAALAATRAIGAVAAVTSGIKWPNDLVTRPAPASPRSLKIGGILAEARSRRDALEFAVVGLGINTAPLGAELPAGLRERSTSLSDLAGRRVRREELLPAIVKEMQVILESLESDGLAPLLPELRAASSLLGREIDVTLQDRVVTGVARDFDSTGALILEKKDGSRELVVAGDATLRESR